MAVNTTFADDLPPNLFDLTTLLSLASTTLILAVAYHTSHKTLSATTPDNLRLLFIWFAFDALIHFVLEGGFLYHCFFSYIPNDGITVADLRSGRYYPTQKGYLGHDDRVWGSQAAGPSHPLAALWMVYARADKRWAGADTVIVSLELLTVFIVAPLSVLVCRDIAKKNPRYNIVMIIVATAELYGGFITFCPEWLTGNQHLNGSNFLYFWVYLVFFNVLWVVFPLYAIYVGSNAIAAAFDKKKVAANVAKKSK